MHNCSNFMFVGILNFLELISLNSGFNDSGGSSMQQASSSVSAEVILLPSIALKIIHEQVILTKLKLHFFECEIRNLIFIKLFYSCCKLCYDELEFKLGT